MKEQLFEYIRSLICDLTNRPISRVSWLKADIGLDSLDIAQLLVEIEKKYPRLNIDEIFFMEDVTIEQLINAIEKVL